MLAANLGRGPSRVMLFEPKREQKREQKRGHRRACALAVGACLVVGCQASGSVGLGSTTSADRRDEPVPIVRQECTGEGPTVDANNDGKADIRHVLAAGKKTCSQIDMNFDGNPDVFRFYTPDGENVLFEQEDFDFDGRIDQQAFFKGPAMDRKELDTNFDGLVDTWMWCNGAFVARAERARRKPGRVDTWEKYSGDGVLAEIEYDENNDGKPEKWEVFTDGTLSELRYDMTNDGEPDRTESGADLGDEKDKPVSCDGTPLVPETQQAAPSAPEPPPIANPGEEQGSAVDSSADNGAAEPAAAPAGADAKKPAADAKKAPKSVDAQKAPVGAGKPGKDK